MVNNKSFGYTWETGIIVNPTKFQFAKKCVEFVGFRVSENEIEPSSSSSFV